VAGEEAHAKGEDGLQRAKQWLDLSTRVSSVWAYDHPVLAEMVHFEWPYAATEQEKDFSFDFGGTFRGEPIDNQSFLAEVKNYHCELDLPSLFLDFLAKCYVALGDKPKRCDNFLWISWSPFQARSWHKHATTDNVRRALLQKTNRQRALGVDNEADAKAKLDSERMAGVASRIWLITLSDRQEMLVPTESHYYKMAEIFARERGVGS
jgi:hypothetical protein